MTIKYWFAKMRSFIYGGHLDDMINDVKDNTAKTKKRIDDIYERVHMDGEDRWFIQERKNKDNCNVTK
jgi:hypothetical protein